jgi:carbon storage regulator CsrA
VVLPSHGVTISVLEVKRSRVCLGIVAPSGTPVHRNEVWQRICLETGDDAEAGGMAERMAVA